MLRNRAQVLLKDSISQFESIKVIFWFLNNNWIQSQPQTIPWSISSYILFWLSFTERVLNDHSVVIANQVEPWSLPSHCFAILHNLIFALSFVANGQPRDGVIYLCGASFGSLMIQNNPRCNFYWYVGLLLLFSTSWTFRNKLSRRGVLR